MSNYKIGLCIEVLEGQHLIIYSGFVQTPSTIFQNFSKTFAKPNYQISKTIKHIFMCILKPHKNRKALLLALNFMIFW